MKIYSPRSDGILAFSCTDVNIICSWDNAVNMQYYSGKLISFDCQ